VATLEFHSPTSVASGWLSSGDRDWCAFASCECSYSVWLRVC